MKDTSMTTIKVKQINRNKVYNYIYNEGSTCKLMITQALTMGLSTVTQNLKLLEEEGLIAKSGYFESTGGRKADAVAIVRDVKIAIGVAILKEMVQIVATNLYGHAICESVVPLRFWDSEAYYRSLGKAVNDFIDEQSLAPEKILGVSIATQGIIANDGQSVSYGVLLGNGAMQLSAFENYIPYPCRLEHDSKAAAKLELWHHRALENAVVLLLNRNLGGAIIVDGSVQHGSNMRSGTLEHLCMDTRGALCYCGKRGCLETYCSANSLEQAAHMTIDDFFVWLREGDATSARVWHDYLTYLARAICNLSVIIDGKFIISGYLAPYFIKDDLDALFALIQEHATFPLQRSDILLGANGQFTQAIGSSLFYIEEFLKNI